MFQKNTPLGSCLHEKWIAENIVTLPGIDHSLS
jgi:hypothetical protein